MHVRVNEPVNVDKDVAAVYPDFFIVHFYHGFLHIAHQDFQGHNSVVQIIQVAVDFNNPLDLLAVFCHVLKGFFRLLLKPMLFYPVIHIAIKILNQERPAVAVP